MNRLTLRIARSLSPTAMLGLLIVLLYLVLALFAPWIAPYSETTVVGGQFEPWSSTHLLGTDNLGRDMLSRLIFGGRNTLGLTFLITLLAFVLGIGLGLLAAILRGTADQVISRGVDVFLAIPQLIFALLMLTVFGQSTLVLILVLTVSESTRVFRVARAVGEGVATLDFVEVARLRGESTFWILRREILPIVLPPLMTEFGVRFGYVLLLISSLAFLGLGIQPPAAIWGSMVRDNAILITFGDVTPLLPALAIALIAVGINFTVDWLIEQNSGKA